MRQRRWPPDNDDPPDWFFNLVFLVCGVVAFGVLILFVALVVKAITFLF